MGNGIFSLQSLIMVMVFATTVMAVLFASSWLLALNSPIKRRLAEIADPEGAVRGKESRVGAFRMRWTEPVGKVLMPAEDWKKSRLKTRLVHAGLRHPQAMLVYLAAKVVLGFALPLLMAIPAFLLGYVGKAPLLGVVFVCLFAFIGFFGPNAWLAHRSERRLRAITDSFPDALDMLVVCVEAGLGLDAGIQRVGREISISHPELAEELQVVSLELRAGKARDEALRALAERTGVEDIATLTSILIQTEHFGTSIATALRDQANEMRAIRIQRARERAAKLPVKLIFPIMVFIFPSLFLIILGPAAIRIYHAILSTHGGH